MKKLTSYLALATVTIWLINTLKYQDILTAYLALLFSFIAYKLAMLHPKEKGYNLKDALNQAEKIKGQWD